MQPCYVFDIDGTIADLSHRLHHIQKDKKDWDAFFNDCMNDVPIPHVCDLVIALSITKPIVLVSGRSDRIRAETMAWLEDRAAISYSRLYMRKNGDHRPDNLVKAELLDQLIADGFKPLMAFDDRNQVVEMWRARGIPCAQVADGNF